MNYDDVISFDNLYKGLQKSKRGVMWKDSVAGYSLNGLKNTYKLRQTLLNDSYEISKYQVFKIYEPKEREIVATRIKDRQFQRSLCDNVIYPNLTKSFIRDNVACQRGKGVDDCLNRIETHLHRYYRKYGNEGYALKCDIHHFFPETPHSLAKDIIRKRIPDTRCADAVCQIIDSFDGDKGIGLGSQVSQLIQLAVLDDLDHYIKEHLHIKYYVRYMDDFVLIHQSKDYLKYCLSEIDRIVKSKGLSLNPKTNIFPLKQGITMLKWRFILTDTGKIIMKMSKHSIKRERRKLKKLFAKSLRNEIALEDIYNSYQSWQAHANRGNTYRQVQRMNRLYNRLKGQLNNENYQVNS